MADKSVGELIAAQSVTPTDLFVLEQNGTAKKLTGQILENWLVSFADGHGGIQSIVKHSTSGLKDTYRITLADTTTFDFIVTNGKAISGVNQTDVSGLTRTYTISFNDGTSETFAVTDGRSITDIAKTETNVLIDTYTISYNDGTSSTFTVKNGKGIQSFEKVSTVGLVDTYKIEYNDGTSDEFTVTNGEKGDKGDNTYTHIKFASQKPTESSHSMGDVPDKWIGFYWGNFEEAPTDWALYKWYQFKGDKGDPGDPAKLNSSTVTYQASDSGTIIPSESWQTAVPVVAQGKYLWTRTTQRFNTGSPVVSYSVSRMGLDGSGSVSSVANISPDANGNVSLTAADVKALPIGGGIMEGPINMNGQPIGGLNAPTENDQAANMGYVKQQVRKAAPWNLLDNSDFRNPVNQRGLTIYTNADYTIDRWRTYGSGIVSVVPGGIVLSGSLYQLLEGFKVSADKVYTMCAGFSDGTVVCGSGTFETGFGTWDAKTIVWAEMQNDLVRIRLRNTDNIFSWTALYEGEYTVETLPGYHPKGYVTELNECRWYYRNQMFYVLRCYANGYLNGVGFEPMRVIPTITVVSTQSMIGDAIDGETTAMPSKNISLGYIANTRFETDNYYRIVLELDADLK